MAIRAIDYGPAASDACTSTLVTFACSAPRRTYTAEFLEAV